MRLFDAEGRISVDSTAAEAGLRKTEGKFRETMSRIDRMRAEADIDADISDVEAKMERAQKLIEKFRRQRAEAKTSVDSDQATRKLTRLDAQMRRLDGRRAKLRVELDARSAVVEKELGKMARSLDRVKDKTNGTLNPLKSLGDRLNQARVTLGPLSLSLRALTIGLAVAGPAVIHVAGALGSLVGILGTGAVGAAGLAGSALLGFGVIFGGLVASIKANKDLFALKGKKTKSSLKDDLLDLQKTWGKLTRSGAKEFLSGMQGGLQNVRKELPMLAKHTNTAFGIMGKGVEKFTKMLASKEGSGNLDKILGNANKALGPLLDGMTNLGQVALRVFASFSRSLPDMGKGFKDWTRGLLESTSNTDKLDKGVDRVVKHAKLVGTFFLEAGRAVRDVFNVAAGDGEPMVKRMAGWMRDVQKWAKSGDAQEFFDRAREGSGKMLDVAKQFLPIIGKWVTAMEPFSNAFLEAVTAAGKLLNAFLDLNGGGKELMSVLAGLYVLHKAVGWANALSRSLAAMKVSGSVLDAILGGGKKKGPQSPIIVPGAGGGAKEGKGWVSRFAGAVKNGLASGAAYFGFDKLARRISKIKVPALSKGSLLRGLGIAGIVAEGGLIADNLSRGLTNKLKKVSGPVGTALRDAFKITKITTPFGWLSNLGSTLKDPIGTIKHLKDEFTGLLGLSKKPLKFKWEGSGNEAIFDKLKAGIASTKTLTGSLKGRKLLFDIETRGGKEATRTLQVLGRTRLGRKVLNIIAQGGPAALRTIVALGRTRLGNKILRIIERGGAPAERILRSLQSKSLRAKLLRILEKGGSQVEARLNKLLGYKLGTSTKDIKQRGGESVDQLMKKLRAAVLGSATKSLLANDQATGKINGLRSITDLGTAYKHVKAIFEGKAGSLAGGNAKGGFGSSGGSPVDAAARAAAGRNTPMDGQKGGVVREPRYVVGEERAMEVVISSNPAVRGRNRRLLSVAAKMLGLKNPPQRVGEDTFAGFAAGGIPGGGGTFPGLTPAFSGGPKAPKSRKPSWYGKGGRARNKKNTKKQKKAIGVGGQWQRRIGYLQSRETDLEREASIRESQVKEPDTFLKQVGTNPDGTPAYAIAWDVVKQFQSQMQLVQNVYDQIWRVVQELQAAIPKAIAAQQNEINARQSAISGHRNSLKHLRSALGKEEARKGKRRRPKEISRLRKLISKTEGKIGDHGREIGDSRTLISDYKAEGKDAGFRLREAFIRANDYKADIAAVGGRALKEKSDSQAGTTATTDTAAAATGASPVQLLGSGRYDLLSQFGSNFTNVRSSQAATGAALGMSNGGLATARLGAALARPIASAVAAATAGQSSERKIELHTHYNGGVEDTHTWAQRQLFEVGATGI